MDSTLNPTTKATNSRRGISLRWCCCSTHPQYRIGCYLFDPSYMLLSSYRWKGWLYSGNHNRVYYSLPSRKLTLHQDKQLNRSLRTDHKPAEVKDTLCRHKD